MLADTDFQLCGHLHFVSHARHRGGQWGERRATRRGEGLEFADYRPYTPGDNPRRVDWNLYARLDRPYVRLFDAEEDLHVVLLIDSSGSMGWEAVGANRWVAVQNLTLALGGVALLHGDVLSAAWQPAAPGSRNWGPHRGPGYFASWQTWASTPSPQGGAIIGATMQEYATRATRPALVVVLTDGYDRDGIAIGAAALAAHGHEIILLHVLTPEERAPSFRGDLRLVDTETGVGREVSMDAAVLAAYRQNLDSWCRDLRAVASKHHGRYALLRAEQPLRRQLLDDLRHADVLR